jgi:hypothetical protein
VAALIGGWLAVKGIGVLTPLVFAALTMEKRIYIVELLIIQPFQAFLP